MAELPSLLESVDEFVNDEAKVVTYDWVSQQLGIHVNLAKTVLEKYVEQRKAAKSVKPLDVVYSVGGKSGCCLKFLLAREENLEDTKSRLDCILYTHVYSIQNAGFANLEALYNSNYLKFKSSIDQCNEFSSVTCQGFRLRTAQEIQQGSNCSRNDQHSVDVKPERLQKEEPKVATKIADSGLEKSESLKENAKPPTKKADGKSAFATFFSKNQEKQAAVKEENKEDAKKISNKRIVRENSEDEGVSPKVNETKRFKLASDDKREKPDAKTKVTKKGKGAKAGKKSSSKNVQRKRIQQMSESDASNDEEDSCEELGGLDPTPDMPVATVIESDTEDQVMNSPAASETAKKRGRKLVTKHYEDKDGFIVTKKEFEAYSETEEEIAVTPGPLPEAVRVVEPPKVPVVSTKSAPLSPSKRKQSSITSFFTRK